MSLTHVCVWAGADGYRRVTIEEACQMYPYGVSANSGIFVCSLCAQNVCLTNPGIQRRNFRHNSAAQNRECEDRAQAYAQARMGYNCHPMPLRINVSNRSYFLELGFFHASSSVTGGPNCQKIHITGDSGQKYVYSFERLSSEGITYLNVGNIPSTYYRLDYEHSSQNLERYWPYKTVGIDRKGSFFDCFSGKMLCSGGKAYPNQDYYLLQPRPIGYVPHGISYEIIAEARTEAFTTWYLYKLRAFDFSASVARFFLERSIFLTEKPVIFYPVWPPYIDTPYFMYHSDPMMYFYMQGEDADLNIYPVNMYTQNDVLENGKLYKIYATSKEQLLTLGQSGAIGFSYLMRKPMDMIATLPQVQITSIDGNVLTEDICNHLPKGKQITLQTPFDGKAIIFNNGKLLEIRHLVAEQIITIDISFGYEIKIFQSCDLIRSVKFINNKKDLNSDATDRQLAEKLRNCKGALIAVPHSISSVVDRIHGYPLTKLWLYSEIRSGHIRRSAYLSLLNVISKNRGGK